jgi:hypothetical protein
MRFRQLGLLALAFGSAGTTACTASSSDGRSGSVEVVTRRSAALSLADVARVAVTITGDNIPTPMTSSLANDNATWHGTINDVPIGMARFDGQAFDAEDAVIYVGDATNVSITPGTTSVVALLLQQANAPAPFNNDAPIIDSFTASTNLVGPDQTVRVTGIAHKASGGHLSYAWSADGGTFASPTSASSEWTAPSTTGTYNLTFRATDDTGLAATISFTLVVQNGNAAVTTTFNTWPTADMMTATKTRLEVGDTTTLALAATDADGDTMSYAWTSSCDGTFSAPTAATTDFTLSALPDAGTCALTSTVTDGRGGSNTGTITLKTGPAPTLTIGASVAYHYVSTWNSSTTSGLFTFDGASWAQSPSTAPTDLRRATYIGEIGGKMYQQVRRGPVFSFDGTSWGSVAASPYGLDEQSYLGAMGGKAYHRAYGPNGPVIESFDGTTWATVETNMPNGYFSQDTLIGVIGDKAYHATWNNDTNVREVDAFDGATWTTIPNTNIDESNIGAYSYLGVVGGKAYHYTYNNSIGGYEWLSFDGTTFTVLPIVAPFANVGYNTFVGVLGGKAYHAIYDYQADTSTMYSFDGATWTMIPTNTPLHVGGYTGDFGGSYLGAL